MNKNIESYCSECETYSSFVYDGEDWECENCGFFNSDGEILDYELEERVE